MWQRWTRLAELLGINAIPIVGVLAADWSAATALTVYWIENLIATPLVAARLYLHARWSDPATRSPVAAGSSFAPRTAGVFLATAIPFTLAHGVMLLVVFAQLLHERPDLAALQRAAMAMAVLQAVTFGVDLWTLADWPVARVNERADYLQGRVVLVHLSIIVGMLLLAWLDRPGAFFAFFVGCKVLADITSLLPRVDQGTPGAPPRWLAAIMKHVPAQNGETFDEYWRRTHAPAGPDAPEPSAPPRPHWAKKRRRG